MDLFGILIGVLAVLSGFLFFYLRRRHGKLEHLGIPIVQPFLCFGSPPFSYHKNITHEYYVQVNTTQFIAQIFTFRIPLNAITVNVNPRLLRSDDFKDLILKYPLFKFVGCCDQKCFKTKLLHQVALAVHLKRSR